MSRELEVIPQHMSLRAAAHLLAGAQVSGAPVIDEAGHPIGVLSRADILVHDREQSRPGASDADLGAASTSTRWLEDPSGATREPTRVRDLMTPAVFSVALETPADKVIAEMLALKVHRLFVVDPSGVLVGVISTLDVLRRLQPQ